MSQTPRPASRLTKTAQAIVAVGVTGLAGWFVYNQATRSPQAEWEEAQKMGLRSGLSGAPSGGVAMDTDLVGATPAPTPTPSGIEIRVKKAQDAFLKQNRVHLSLMVSTLEGKKREVWKEGESFRDETAERLYLSDGTTRWIWLPPQKTAYTWKKHPSEKIPFAQSVTIAPKIDYPQSQLATALFARKDNPDVTFLSATTLVQGKETRKANVPDRFRNSASYSETTLTLDSKSGLPTKEEFRSRRTPPSGSMADGAIGGGGVVGVGDAGVGAPSPSPEPIRTFLTATARYDEAPPAGAFRFSPPPGAKVIDIDATVDRWMAKLASAPKFTVAGEGWSMTIHDIQLGKGGEVFLLYTGDTFQSFRTQPLPGGGAKGERVTVTDDAKREYAPLDGDVMTGTYSLLHRPLDGKPLKLAIFGTLRTPGEATIKTLDLTVEGAKKVALPLPAPLPTDFPEYATLLWPGASLARARQAAVVRRLNRTESAIRKGTVTPEIARASEKLAVEAMGEAIPWSVLLQLGRIYKAANLPSDATRVNRSALDAFRKLNPNPKTRLPGEFTRILDQIDP